MKTKKSKQPNWYDLDDLEDITDYVVNRKIKQFKKKEHRNAKRTKFTKRID